MGKPHLRIGIVRAGRHLTIQTADDRQQGIRGWRRKGGPCQLAVEQVHRGDLTTDSIHRGQPRRLHGSEVAIGRDNGEPRTRLLHPAGEARENLYQLELVVEIGLKPQHHLIAGSHRLKPGVTLREVRHGV